MSSGTPSSNPPGGNQADDDSSDGLNATLMLGQQRVLAPPSPSPFEEDEGSIVAGDSMLEDAGDESAAMDAGPGSADDAPLELSDFSVQGDGEERTMIELGDAPLSPAEDRLQLAVDAPAPAPNFTDTLGTLAHGDEDDSVVSSVPQRLFMPKPIVGPPDEPTMLELEDEELEEVEPSRLVPIPDFAHDDERPRPVEQRRTLFGAPGAAPAADVAIPSPGGVSGQVSVARPAAAAPVPPRAAVAAARPVQAAVPVRAAAPVAAAPAAAARPAGTSTGMPVAPPRAAQPAAPVKPAQPVAPAKAAQPVAPVRPAASTSANPRSTALPAAVPSAAVPSAAAQAAAARRPVAASARTGAPAAIDADAPARKGGMGKWIILIVALLMVAGGAAAVVILDPFGLMKPKEAEVVVGPPVVEIASDPSPVEIYDNGRFVGETPIKHEPPAGQAGHELKLVGTKSTFQVKSPRIEGTSYMFIQLPPTKGAAVGHVVVQGADGAEVSLGDKPLGKTPLVFIGSTAAEVTFTVTAGGKTTTVAGKPSAEGIRLDVKLE